LFRDFLRSEYSDENLEFWIACEEYRTLKDDRLVAQAQKIFADFVAIQAPREVRYLQLYSFLNKLISRSFSSHYRTSICTAGHQLVIPSRGLTTYGRRAFSVAGPMFWNSLPRNLRDPSYTAAVFGRSLKTFLFSEYK